MEILKGNLEDFKNGQNDRERQIIRLRTEIKTADQTFRMKDSENQEVTLFVVLSIGLTVSDRHIWFGMFVN